MGLVGCSYLAFFLHSNLPSLNLFSDNRPIDTKSFLQLVSTISDDGNCLPYGCHVYPLEIDDPDFFSHSDTSSTAMDSEAALLTRWSNQHMFNQDRAVWIKPFVTNQSTNATRTFMTGVFDGHGDLGHKVADFAAKKLPQYVARRLNSLPCCQPDDWIMKQLSESFIEIDQDLVPPIALRGGCTASVTLRIDNKLYIANTGDSRTLVVRHATCTDSEKLDPSTVEIIYSTRPDKAHLPDERSRIENLGGKIHTPKDHPTLSRVIVHSTAARPPEAIGLAMSRSLGDWEWGEVGVIPDPIVDTVDLNDLTSSPRTSGFYIAASDGLWDLRRPQFYARLVAEAYCEVNRKNLSQSLYDIVLKAAPREAKWYRDDMTVVVGKL